MAQLVKSPDPCRRDFSSAAYRSPFSSVNMASIRIIFHQSPSIRPSTGKHGELSLATHRAQPHPRQPRYQLQNVWLSPLRNTIVHNNTVLQNTVFYHYVCKAVTLPIHLYKHYVLYTIYFFSRARISRASPQEICATRASSND